jgi:O-methyltransferase involved in polyketide biosynthesis
MESQRRDALVRDPKAVELVGRLEVDFSGVQRLMGEQVNYLLRMREFDRLARAFLAEHPAGVIVDLGWGLGARAYRRLYTGGGARMAGHPGSEVAARWIQASGCS